MFVARKKSAWRDQIQPILRYAFIAWFAYVALQIGYQAWHHIVLWTNIHSLGSEVNAVGSEGFRTHLREVAREHDMKLRDDDIRVVLDPEDKSVRIDVAFRWNVNLVFTRVKGTKVISDLTARWPE